MAWNELNRFIGLFPKTNHLRQYHKWKDSVPRIFFPQQDMDELTP